MLPALYNNHSAALAALGNIDEAVRLLEKALELAPDYDIAKENLTQLQKEEKIQVRQLASAEFDSNYDFPPPIQAQEYRLAA